MQTDKNYNQSSTPQSQTESAEQKKNNNSNSAPQAGSNPQALNKLRILMNAVKSLENNNPK
jgi:hypothetical protein